MADDPPWLTLSEAAVRSGLHRDAIRSRARRGLIPSRHDNRGQWLVQLPAEAMTMDGQANGHDVDREVTTLNEPVADLQAEVAELRVALARAEADRDAARTVAKAEVAARDEVVGELRAMLADARRPWRRRWVG